MPQHGFYDMPLAIVGMACRLPGADNLDEYWQLISRAQNGLCELPPERLDRELYYHPEKGRLGKTYSQIGGVVMERPLDREVCPIDDELVAESDPAHLMMLEVTASACRHAGYDPMALRLRNT
jgi:acyl transferase domain-containing protein